MSTAIEEVIRRATTWQSEFAAAVGSVGAVPCGVRKSEMLFLRACAGEKEPEQVVESGRAYGQSTLYLSHLFPQSRILSIERRRDGEVAEETLRRCAGLRNVCCLFGDARRLMPEMVCPGDVVLIDGPKNLRALRLAFVVMQRCRPGFVFVHDAYQGSVLRGLIERQQPDALFSDSPRFLEAFDQMDGGADASGVDASNETALAYLPCGVGVPTRRHWMELTCADMVTRIRRWKRRRSER